MIKHLSLAASLGLVLFTHNASAKEGILDLSACLTLGTEYYASGTATPGIGIAPTSAEINAAAGAGTLLSTGYNAMGNPGSLPSNLLAGIGGKFAYYNRFALLGDFSISIGSPTGNISGINIAAVGGTNATVPTEPPPKLPTAPWTLFGTDVKTSATVYTNVKAKAVIGFALRSNKDLIVAPFVGISYKNLTQAIQTATPTITTMSSVRSNTNGYNLPLNLTESNLLIGLPIGLNIKAPFNSLTIEVQGTYHIWWSAQTSTPRGDIALSIGTVNAPSKLIIPSDPAGNITGFSGTVSSNANVYTESGIATTWNSNYSIELSGAITWTLEEEEFGLNAIGIGAYYDYDSLTISQPLSNKPANSVASDNAYLNANATTTISASNGILPAITSYQAGIKLVLNY